MGHGPVNPPAALHARGLAKTFGLTTVLRDVELEVRPGEIHGLVGQNGSGKSTLIKILAGYLEPDPGGELRIRDEPVSLPIAPAASRRRGLRFIHQDLGLVDSMSVLENLVVGRGFDTGKGWSIRWRRERDNARKRLARFGLQVDVDAPVARLNSAERTIVAIARGFEELDAGGVTPIIVLDEPTAHLAGNEVSLLFAAIREAVSTGASALFVSHRLDEVLDLCDRVTVLRDGRRVTVVAAADTDEHRLMKSILGRELTQIYPEPRRPGREVVLSVADLAGDRVERLSFDIHAGEILGLTGLLGMGHDDVPYMVFGARRAHGGRVRVAGHKLSLEPRHAIRAGMALLPADRQHAGSAPAATVRENLMLPRSERFFTRGRLRHRAERRYVRELLERFDVRPPAPEARLAELSGGNQQKALLAKWLQQRPLVLLLHEPTHGVDVGARKQIFGLIKEATDQGTAVLLCSTEYDDLAHLCDRVLVMRDGRVRARLTGDAVNKDTIIAQAHASHEPGAAAGAGV